MMLYIIELKKGIFYMLFKLIFFPYTKTLITVQFKMNSIFETLFLFLTKNQPYDHNKLP